MVVEVIHDRGPVPVVMVHSARSAKFAAEYYRGLLGKFLELWRAKYGAVTEAKRWNEYLGAADYRTYTQGQRINAEVIDARRMRVHTAESQADADYQGVGGVSTCHAPRASDLGRHEPENK